VEKSTNTNKNSITIIPINQEHLNQQATLLTLEHIKDGASGYARLASEHSFKNRAICTDASRSHFQLVEDDGTLVTDRKGRKLAKLFFNSIKTKNDEIITPIVKKIMDEVKGVNDLDTSILFEKMNRLTNMQRGVANISEDREDELRENFARELSLMLPNRR
jgi:hypothetical protein